MYIPAHFEMASPEAMHALIASHPFGTLVTRGKAGLDANHIPFELEAGHGPHGLLKAHVARANPVWQDVANGAEVLVIFRAGDAYISPNWYPSKHEAHKQVPTWNYQVVHAHGRITIHDDERYVRGVVARLTRTHEATQPRPWRMSDAPADFLDTLLQSIVGIEIEITRLEGKSKLGQHKEARDIRGPGEALVALGNREIGEAMLERAGEKEQG
ncbi:FMN-binding negative transcriptional regulator [Cupriavidus agavae]|uniref:PaiB family negative transcriptional regulator n=1 Tax=Cupriavidus agavae TaxID=1001822 RepID=A0A4Q7RYX2_9BURK|nr:FMN-binding negative transcriptional regulator [Cupriavidus agavae]RZT39096.1 PaiB family negative transcriptional regulator [Cupriavidus agavae]